MRRLSRQTTKSPMPFQPMLSKSSLGSMHQNAEVFGAYTKVSADVGSVGILIENHTKQFPILTRQFLNILWHKFFVFLGLQNAFGHQAFVRRVNLVDIY